MIKRKISRRRTDKIVSIVSLVTIIAAIFAAINFSELTALAAELSGAFRVNIICDGQNSCVYTQGDTVENLLAQANISLEPRDRVYPAKETMISGAASISVLRVTLGEEIITGEIPFETVTRTSSSLEKGKTRVIQEGAVGKKADVYETLVCESGEKVCNLLYSVTLTEPTAKIIEKGTKEVKKTVTTSSGQALAYSKCITVKATAYTTEGRKYARTATGTKPKVGTVAVDPRVIPLGSRLYITSADGKIVYGTAVAEDTGGKIKNNKIDLFFNTKKECLSFGVRSMKVYVLD